MISEDGVVRPSGKVVISAVGVAMSRKFGLVSTFMRTTLVIGDIEAEEVIEADGNMPSLSASFWRKVAPSNGAPTMSGDESNPSKGNSEISGAGVAMTRKLGLDFRNNKSVAHHR